MTRVKVAYTGHLHTESLHESGALIATDAPKDNGGKGESFSPTDLIGTALGACMLTLMGLMAKKMGFELQGASAEVEKIMASDAPRRIGTLRVHVRVKMELDAVTRAKLEQAALTCPVHASLHPSIQQEIQFVWGLS
jgi:putative redox protein